MRLDNKPKQPSKTRQLNNKNNMDLNEVNHHYLSLPPTASLVDKWMARFDDLIVYGEKRDNCNVPFSKNLPQLLIVILQIIAIRFIFHFIFMIICCY